MKLREGPPPGARPPFRSPEILLPMLLLGWRVLTQPVWALWRDYVLIVSAFWLFILLRPHSTARAQVLLTLAAYLLAIYVAGQFHHTLSALGVGS